MLKWENDITKRKVWGTMDLANKISTIEDVSTLNKFLTGGDHRLVRATVLLDLKMEIIKFNKKPTTCGIKVNNLVENSDQNQNTLIEKLHNEIHSPHLM